MTFDAAMRSSEALLGAAIALQCAQHLSLGPSERVWFTPRLVLAVLLVAGVAPAIVLLGLLVTSLLLLQRFEGPYNGGSDRMSLLLLAGLACARLAPTPLLRQAAIGYVAVQVVASYLLAGVAKAGNPAWRDGGALRELFAGSIYPVSEDLRTWAARPRSMAALGWGIVLFELAFPFALLDPTLLKYALGVAFAFHLANAALFGLDRFVWVWLAAYPTLLWFQAALIAPLLRRG